MNKRKTRKKLYLFFDIARQFGSGGNLLSDSTEVFNTAFNKDNLGSTIGGLTSGITGMISGISDVYDKTSNIKDTTNESNDIANLAGTDFNHNSSYDSLLDQWGNLSYSPSNYKGTDFRQTASEVAANSVSGTLNATLNGATTGAKVGGPLGALIGTIAGTVGGIGAGIGGHQAAVRRSNKEAKSLNNRANWANTEVINNLNKQAELISGDNYNNMMKNIMATGGELNTNGIIQVNNGGLHETNLYEGVPMGVAPDGLPNLVEEGEIIFNDYVFSNRIQAPKELKEKMKLKGKTFADLAKFAQKESEERPNDPISKRGLEDSMNKLQIAQELIKQTEESKSYNGKSYKFSEGGKSTFIEPRIPLLNVKSSVSIPDKLEYKKPNYKALSEYNDNQKSNSKLPTFMRYAPVLGSAIGAASSILTPADYSNADIIENAANNLSREKVNFNPINDYLEYTPLDRNYYLNELKAQSGATKRGIINSGSNAGTTTAGLLAADYNAQRATGDALMKMDMYNNQQKQRISDFNRQTNMFNSQGNMQASQANANLSRYRDNMRLEALNRVAQMREAIDTARLNSIYGNLTNMFDNFGNIGYDNFAMNMANNSGLRYGMNLNGSTNYKKDLGGLLTKKLRKKENNYGTGIYSSRK